MKIIELSTFSTFSVGNIMRNLMVEIESKGDECFVFFGRGANKHEPNIDKFSYPLSVKKNALLARLFDNDGICDRLSTRHLIKKIRSIQPDIIHIHCLHGYYLNYKYLFEYLKKSKIKVVWTMHDTWAFTGHCCYFNSVNCEKWKTRCFKCPAKNDYPKSMLIDRSRKNYLTKKHYFNLIDKENLIIVSPSKWLDDKINCSFLSKYKHYIIYNGIDIGRFIDKGFQREKILLAVASVWDRRKNIQRVIEIASNLKEWKVVVVGKVDSNIVRKNSDNIKFISRTTNLDELVDLYNRAFVLINPTLDDNLPTVNIEAQLCGCYVLSSDVGGAKETDIGRLKLIPDDEFIDDTYLNCLKSNSIIELNNNIELNNKFDKAEMAKKYYMLFKNML